MVKEKEHRRGYEAKNWRGKVRKETQKERKLKKTKTEKETKNTNINRRYKVKCGEEEKKTKWEWENCNMELNWIRKRLIIKQGSRNNDKEWQKKKGNEVEYESRSRKETREHE